MGRLKDKVAFVTGAGSVGPGWGNGKAAAVMFAREGAKVVAIDVVSSAAEETVEIIKQEGGEAIALEADVTRSDNVADAVQKAVRAYGGIDILHNNVGTLALGGPVEASEESWHKVMDINLTSMFLTCKHVIPTMLDKGGGSIVNISSIIANTSVGPNYISYTASKGGVNSLTRAVATQYAESGIRCNAVMPGLMLTPMVEQTLGSGLSRKELDDMIARREKAVPLGYMGSAWDVARTSLFFASDDSAYITGQTIAVDGGVTLRSIGF